MERILARLIGLAVLLLPFNSVPWYPEVLGELRREAWVGPGLLALGVWALCAFWRLRVVWGRGPGAALLLAWAVWGLLGTGVNVLVQGDTDFKGRSLLEKAALQTAVVFFVLGVTGAVYQSQRKKDAGTTLRWFRRVMVLSAIVPVTLAGVEGLWLTTGWAAAESLVRSVSAVVHSTVEYQRRVRSVAGEASWFGIWLAFVLPWLISGIRAGLIRSVGIAVLVVAGTFTFSRFAWIVIGLTCVGFQLSAWVAGRERVRGLVLAVVLVGGMAAGWIADPERTGTVLRSFRLTDETPYWVSNVSRLGMQLTGARMALARPALGVGFGGFGFGAREFVPEWALVSPEVQKWLVDVAGTAWPPVHGLWARLAAETGFVGLALFLAGWAAFLRSVWRRAKRCESTGEVELRDLWMAVFWSGVNCLLVGFAFDSFRFGGYWLLLGVGWAAMASEDGGSGKRGETGVA